MAGTMMEAAVRNSAYQPQDLSVVQLFEENCPIAAYAPWNSIDGNIETFYLDEVLASVGWRAVNQEWMESTGRTMSRTERLMIGGGTFWLDRAIEKTNPKKAPSEWANQARMKTLAMTRELTRAFFEGSDLVSPYEMVGIRRRATSSQVVLQAAGGGPLTLAKLNTAMDMVAGMDNVHIFSNRTAVRKAQYLVEATGGSVRFTVEQDMFGKIINKYAGLPWHIIEDKGDQATIFAFDEDPGDGIADCTSIYFVSLSDDGVSFIYNGDSGRSIQVSDLGYTQSTTRRTGLIEFYPGLKVKHPRSFVRLYGITNA